MTHDRSADTGITATQASGRKVHSYASPPRPDHCAQVSALAFRPTQDGTAPTRSATPERALGVAKQLRTGQVDINGGRFNPLAPFGGYKRSGIGREIGPLAIEEFFQLKSIQR